MKNLDWVETKKECELNEKGELIIKKITLELAKKKILGLEKKDFFDYIFRIVGLTAIFTPLLLFYLQQQKEREKQQTLFQLEVYSNVTSQLHTLLSKQANTIEFDKSKEKLYYELYPKLLLLGDTSIIKKANEIKTNINEYKNIIESKGLIDSLLGNIDDYNEWIDYPTYYDYKFNLMTYKNKYFNFYAAFLGNTNELKISLSNLIRLEKPKSETSLKLIDSCIELIDSSYNISEILNTDFKDIEVTIMKAGKKLPISINKAVMDQLDENSKNLERIYYKLFWIAESYIKYLNKLAESQDSLMTKSNKLLSTN